MLLARTHTSSTLLEQMTSQILWGETAITTPRLPAGQGYREGWGAVSSQSP